MKPVIKKIFLVILIFIFVFSVTSCSARPKVSKPFQYRGFSKAKYKSFEKNSTYVRMKDGVRIAVDYYLPKGQGAKGKKFPVIFQYTPYGRAYCIPGAKTSGSSSMLDRTNPDSPVYGSTGEQIRTFLSHGYAYACADIRGTGASYGVKKDYMPEIATDGKALIDWLASQKWSTGKVGMYGGSYLGYSQFAVAGQKPRALKCIFPEVVPLDGYTGEIRPGGVFLDEYSTTDTQSYLELDCYKPDDNIYPTAPVIDEDGDGDFADEIPIDKNHSGSFLDDYNYPNDPHDEPQYRDGKKRHHIYYLAAYEHKKNVPYNKVGSMAPFIDSKLDFGGGTIRTPYDVAPAASIRAIQQSGIAVYSHGSWMDPFVRGSTEIYDTLKETNPAKLIIDPGYHETYSPYWAYCGENEEKSIKAYTQELLRYFDRYLKGIHNGIDTEAPVYLYNMNGDGWRAEKEWPLKRQKKTDFYFQKGHVLSTRKGPSGTDTYQVDLTQDSSYPSKEHDFRVSRWVMSAPDQVPDRTEQDKKCLTYTTSRLQKDTEVTGYPIASFFASSTSRDADFHIYMEDVAPNGKAILVTEGILRAGFARLQNPNTMVQAGKDGVNVLPKLPWHGYEKSQYNPNIFANHSIVKLVIDLFPTSWTFKAGHRIRFSLACADSPTFENNPHVKNGDTITIYRDSKHPSKLTLPLIPR